LFCLTGILAIEKDSRDPQFMSNLHHLGPVQVDHHMHSFRPVEDAATVAVSIAKLSILAG
jgi:hypothetical protein